jgi:hypothetical protein
LKPACGPQSAPPETGKNTGKNTTARSLRAAFFSITGGGQSGGASGGSGGPFGLPAVRSGGAAANLPWIDFVKVQTGIQWYAGIFGEISTEIGGADGLGRGRLTGSLPASGTAFDLGRGTGRGAARADTCPPP